MILDMRMVSMRPKGNSGGTIMNDKLLGKVLAAIAAVIIACYVLMNIGQIMAWVFASSIALIFLTPLLTIAVMVIFFTLYSRK